MVATVETPKKMVAKVEIHKKVDAIQIYLAFGHILCDAHASPVGVLYLLIEWRKKRMKRFEHQKMYHG